MPSLYVVGTPIGNLEDVTLRALRILREVKLIAAEDTRKTKRLLNTYAIKTPMTSYHERNKWTKMDYILKCLEEGDLALVSEAGMPGISDPGYELVMTAIKRGIPVIPVPGPSAINTALVVSGLPTQHFTYLGFLPHRSGERRGLLEAVAGDEATLVFFESPHRLLVSLNDILEVLGDRKIAVCRELTKLHEEVFRSTIREAMAYFTGPRGEFTLVVEGKREKVKPQVTESIEQKMRSLRASGLKAKTAIAQLSVETGLPRKDLYRTWLKLRAGSSTS